MNDGSLKVEICVTGTIEYRDAGRNIIKTVDFQGKAPLVGENDGMDNRQHGEAGGAERDNPPIQ